MVTLSRDEARSYLLGQLGLRQVVHRDPRQLLRALRCIQLDPLDAIGTNVDLVAFARVDGLVRGDVFRAVYPGHAFEHWAKERCLLPASAFSMYRHHAAEAPWWRHEERVNRLPTALIAEVLHEIRERGPLSPAQLTDRGNVLPLDWGGWKGTGKAHSMAIEVLWTRCDIVVCGREGNTKLYDVPERALKKVAGRGSRVGHGSRDSQVATDFHRWALLERVEAAGLLSRSGGATWSMLSEARKARIPEQLIEEGLLEEVVIEGSKRPYLAPAGFRRRSFPPPDGRIRILGPLDPLLWDRPLVKHVFGFEYVWEVYKPAHQRRWGWYVCPLLQGDRFVGRLEGVTDRVLRIRKLWREKDATIDDDALDETLARHAASCGVRRVVRPR